MATVKELRAEAKELGVKLGRDIRTKDQIQAAINEHRAGSEPENVADAPKKGNRVPKSRKQKTRENITTASAALDRVAKKQEAKSKKKDKKSKQGQGGGGSQGIAAHWAFLFDANEEAFRNGDFDSILTDDEITANLRDTFQKDSAVFSEVSRVRGRYNRGVLTGGVPQHETTRFIRTEDGKVLRATARGKALKNSKDS